MTDGLTVANRFSRTLGQIAERRTAKVFLFLIAVLLIAGRTGSAHAFIEKNGRKYEDIDIISVPGADCALRRDGRLLLKVKLPAGVDGKYQLRVAHVDITESQNPITVSCVRPGFKMRSIVIAFSPAAWSYVNPPCAASNNAESEEARKCKKAQADARNVKIEYPEAVRLDLESSAN
jgi:hypothetical protein